MTLPDIADRRTWLIARRRLLQQEKELTRLTDEVSAARRQLPMVRLEKEYRLRGSDGEVALLDLFGEHDQLVVQHFMFDPSWDVGCHSCSAMAASTAHPAVLDQLATRGTAFAAVSRADLPRLRRYAEAQGWTFPWYSSRDSDFNLDFHVTLDPDLVAPEYNFRDAEELTAAGEEWLTEYRGEQPGISCFLRDGEDVFHSYSSYGRGVEVMMPAYHLLDLTALGRQEGWEEPRGRAPTLFRSDSGVLSGELVQD